MKNNLSLVDYFILQGITDLPQFQAPVFIFVLLIYLIILCGNSAILLLICTDRQLHTPMYYFLSQLSIMDLCFTTVTLHKTLEAYVTANNIVSVSACITQMYFYVALLCCEFMLLTAMGYDRYVAICYPLQYVTIMNSKVYSLLISVCWFLGLMGGVPAAFIAYKIHCFKSSKVNHFFCDLLVIMKLFCQNASIMEHMIYVESLFVGFLPCTFTILSYIYIIRSILRITSSSGRRKAFYTCSSHITVVSLLYTTMFFLYMRPTTSITLESDKLFALSISTLTPMLNPVIYSLKNKDVKMAFHRLIGMGNKVFLDFFNNVPFFIQKRKTKM